MKKSKEEIIAQIKGVIGDNTSDEALALLEDVSDTFDGLQGGSTKELEDKIAELEKKIEETDTNWRKKYSDRFDNPSPKPSPSEDGGSPSEDDGEGEHDEPKTFEELFTTD